MSQTIVPQSEPLRDLERIARLLSLRHRTPDARAHWAHTLQMIAENRVNGDGAHLIGQAREELATLNSNGHMHSAIFCDHNFKRYWLLDEFGFVLLAFPWGKQGKRDAQIAQLQHEAPAALALAQRAEKRHPALKGRTLRGAQLYANSAVKRAKKGYTVASQGNSDPYQVTHRCTCKDFQNGEAGITPGAPNIAAEGKEEIIICKHRAATIIHEQLEATK